MATGRFALPNIDPSPQGYSACFNDTKQSSAWSCDIIYPIWSIEVQKDSNAEKESEISYNLTLRAVDDDKYPFPWGAQPPSISTVSMKLVNDTSDIARGPAWWLRTTYNKTVIVSDTKLSTVDKRGWGGDDADYEDYNSFHRFKNKPMNAKVGEQPWICTWPNTVIEFFIYPSENSTGYHPTPTSAGNVDATSTEQSYATSTTAWDPWKLPIYPHVYKMMERRFLWDEESVATCTQIEVIGDGTKCKALEKNGTRITMTIEEDEDEDFIEGLDLEWTNKSKRSVPLMKRTSPALTDCACIWKSQ